MQCGSKSNSHLNGLMLLALRPSRDSTTPAAFTNKTPISLNSIIWRPLTYAFAVCTPDSSNFCVGGSDEHTTLCGCCLYMVKERDAFSYRLWNLWARMLLFLHPFSASGWVICLYTIPVWFGFRDTRNDDVNEAGIVAYLDCRISAFG